MIQYKCPICGAELSFPDDQQGRIDTCACGDKFRVPDVVQWPTRSPISDRPSDPIAPEPEKPGESPPGTPSHGRAVTSTQDATVQGIGFGVLLAITLLGLGFILLFCFWPCGLISIVMGVMAPFVGIGSLRGPCPFCGHQVFVNQRSGGVTCPACKKRLLIRGTTFELVE